MADLLNIGTTSLLNFQNQINTTGHNISNATTEGYSRQYVSLTTNFPTRLGAGFMGNGARIDSINRMSDNITNLQIFQYSSLQKQLSTFYDKALNLDSLFSNEALNVNNSLNSFFSTLQVANESPDSIPSREVLLSNANVMTNNFKLIDGQLSEVTSEINREMRLVVDRINTLASNIVKSNKHIIGMQPAPAPDLLDQRDRLLGDLSELVAITVVEQDDGSVNVSIGNGQSLVVTGSALTLDTKANPLDSTKLDVTVKINGTDAVITNSISGGQLGGLLNLQDDLVIPIKRQLDLLALGLRDAMNTQNKLGMDLNSNLGKNLFTDINTASQLLDRAVSHPNNTGTAVLSVSINTLSNIEPSGYKLNVAAGPSYTLTRLSDNTTTVFASFPQTIDGMTISISSGATATGDIFSIEPTKNAVKTFDVALTNASEIALAAPVSVISKQSNTGLGEIKLDSVTDTTNSAFTTTAGTLTPPIRIEFTSSTTYNVVNATTSAVLEAGITYTPGATNQVFPTPGALDYGYRVSLTGAPDNGDSFTINYNSGGIADNTNGLLISNIEQSKIFLGGASTLSDVYAKLTSDLGNQTNQADLDSEATNVLLLQSKAKRESISGVNIDEETANLIKYQQSYQAAAQMIATAKSIFDILMASIAR